MDSTPQKNTKKIDTFSIASVVIGAICFVLMELTTFKTIYLVGCLLLSIIGLALAFAARINIRKTNAQGKKTALSAFILNLIASSGLIVWLIRSALGNPAFGVSTEEDKKMIFFILTCLAVCVLAAIISVCYRKIAKRDS